jgi:hypothetical protein
VSLSFCWGQEFLAATREEEEGSLSNHRELIIVRRQLCPCLNTARFPLASGFPTEKAEGGFVPLISWRRIRAADKQTGMDMKPCIATELSD